MAIRRSRSRRMHRKRSASRRRQQTSRRRSGSRRTRRSRSRRRSKRVGVRSPASKYFTKVFCISLYDAEMRWKKVSKQFKKVGLDVQRFIGIDGRCKKEGAQACLQKLKSFELAYNVRLPYDKKDMEGLKALVPAGSLTIGTILLLRAQVRNKWKRMLIFEDDVEFVRGFNKKFAQGVKEIGNSNWDVLYLGCGGSCGNRDIREGQDSYHPHASIGNQHYGTNVYTHDKRDLRSMCDHCEYFSEHITKAEGAKGTWAYGYSLAGAKKVLRLLDNNAGDHIDQLLADLSRDGDIRALAFDPIVVHHEYGTGGSSFIPWDW